MSFLLWWALIAQAENLELQKPEKEIVYKKVTHIDLDGAKVDGEKGLPQEFFLYQVKTPKIKSFLEDRLNFSFRNYNEVAQ